jgi:hypothetical protein
MNHQYLRLLSLLVLSALLLAGPAAAHPTRALPSPAEANVVAPAAAIPAGANDAAVEWLSTIGGEVYAVGTDGTAAYVAGGTGLTILDVRNPTQPVRLGSLQLRFSWLTHPTLFRAGGILYIAPGDDQYYGTPLLIVDVSDPYHPRLITSYQPRPNISFSGVWVVGNRAYLGGSQFLILDVSDPARPVSIGSYDIGIGSGHIQVVGNLAYLGGDGLGSYLKGIILDVSDPAHPTRRGQFTATESYVVGNMVYAIAPVKIVSGGDCEGLRLRVFDTSDPDNPRERGSLALPGSGSCAHIRVANNLAYITGVGAGLRIVDVGNPDQPVLQSSYGTFAMSDLRVVGERAYVAAGSGGLQIVDVRDSAHPAALGAYNPLQHAKDVQVIGSLAYVAAGQTGLRIFDVSNPARPTLRGSANTPSAISIQVVGSLAYIADGDAGLKIFDVSNPALPTLRGSVDTPGYANDIQVVGSLAYIADNTNGLQIVDVSHPATPVLHSHVGNGLGKPFVSLQIVGNLAYTADTAGFQIFDLSDPDHITLLSNNGTLSFDDIRVANGFAYMHSFDIDPGRSDYVSVYDVHDPVHPVWMSDTQVTLGMYSLRVMDDLLYTGASQGVAIYDLHDPAHPSLSPIGGGGGLFASSNNTCHGCRW